MKRGKHGVTRKVVVPLPCGSEMEDFYLQEAQSRGIGLPTLFYNLLEDRREALGGKGRGIWFPRGIPQMVENIPHDHIRQDDNEHINIDPKLAGQLLGGEDE